MAEKLQPVRSESEIVVGAIYVLRTCACCLRDHRFMVLRYLGVQSVWLQGPGPTWDTTLRCEKHQYPGWICPIAAIPQGRLFRVVDGLQPRRVKTAVGRSESR